MMRIFLPLFFINVAFCDVMTDISDKVKTHFNDTYMNQDVHVTFDRADILKNWENMPEFQEIKTLENEKFQIILSKNMGSIYGKIEVMVDVPVLSSAFSPSSVIQEEDIVMQKFPLAKLRSDVILKKVDLVGKKPKSKIIPKNTALSSNDLDSPLIIKKDAIVTIIYKTEHLCLTTQAKALKDAYKGETIRFEVSNKSKRHVDALVLDAHTAELYKRHM